MRGRCAASEDVAVARCALRRDVVRAPRDFGLVISFYAATTDVDRRVMSHDQSCTLQHFVYSSILSHAVYMHPHSSEVAHATCATSEHCTMGPSRRARRSAPVHRARRLPVSRSQALATGRTRSDTLLRTLLSPRPACTRRMTPPCAWSCRACAAAPAPTGFPGTHAHPTPPTHRASRRPRSCTRASQRRAPHRS